MDVSLLLSTDGAPVSKSHRRSASPAIADGNHTVPLSTLQRSSSEHILSLAGFENSPRQKPRLKNLYLSHVHDGRAETNSQSFLFENSSTSSVSSTAPSLQSAQSPHTIFNSTVILLPPPGVSLLNKPATASFHSAEQGDAERAMPALGNLALRSHEAQTGHTPQTSGTHCGTPAVTFGTPQPSQIGNVQYFRGGFFEILPNGQESFYKASRPETGRMSTDNTADAPPLKSNDKSNKMHKRAASAQDIASYSVSRMPCNTGQPIKSETSPSRFNKDHPTAEESRLSLTARESSLSSTQKEPECRFKKDCDTGSQLRKVISHLFGRNRVCTLRIPKHVWVSYCRKHYQRMRYRNAKTYPLTQMELVQLQIRRLQMWSNENKERGSGPYIRMWAFSLRKCEQNRLKNGGASVVDLWLMKHVAEDYSTDEILRIAEHLHGEIKEGRLTRVPEIEFLPDIIAPNSTKASNAVRGSRRSGRPPSDVKIPKRKAPESLDLGRHDAAYSDGTCVEAKRRHVRSDSAYEPVSPSGRRARVVRPPYDTDADSARLAPMAFQLAYSAIEPPPPLSAAPTPNRATAAPPMIPPLEECRKSNVQCKCSQPPAEYYSGDQQYYQQRQGSHSWDGSDLVHPAGSDGYYAPYSGHHQTFPPISTQLDDRFSRGVAEYHDCPESFGRLISSDSNNCSTSLQAIPESRLATYLASQGSHSNHHPQGCTPSGPTSCTEDIHSSINKGVRISNQEETTGHKSPISHRPPTADSWRSQAPAHYKLPVSVSPEFSHREHFPNSISYPPPPGLKHSHDTIYTGEFGASQRLESRHHNQASTDPVFGTQHYEYSERQNSMFDSSIRTEERSPFAHSRYSMSQHDGGRHNDMGVMSGDTKQRQRRRNLPKNTVDKLRAWFVTHLQHPYPTEDEKEDLMRQTGLQMNQISNWFINARRRQLPTMINNACAETDMLHGRAAPDGASISSADRSDMVNSGADGETSYNTSSYMRDYVHWEKFSSEINAFVK